MYTAIDLMSAFVAGSCFLSAVHCIFANQRGLAALMAFLMLVNLAFIFLLG